MKFYISMCLIFIVLYMSIFNYIQFYAHENILIYTLMVIQETGTNAGQVVLYIG
jgi:hypothetical protein